MIEIINEPLLLQLVGYLYHWQMGFNSVFKGLKETGWAPGSLWPRAQKLAPTGTRFSDRLFCIESLYGLRYAGTAPLLLSSLM